MVASGLLALVVATAFAVLLSSVADLRTSERRARQSAEVLVVANRLERLVVDLETGQRGFVITGQQRFLQPWRDARVAFPEEASNLEQLVSDNTEQQARAQRITQGITSYLRDYSIPLVTTAHFAGYLTRAIVKPVREAAAMADRLAHGDLSVRIPERGIAEIGVLQRSFNTMAESLEQSRGELAASRTRIVAAGDQARRRIERDLHDGIQQRLVSLVLDLRTAEAVVPPELAELRRRSLLRSPTA